MQLLNKQNGKKYSEKQANIMTERKPELIIIAGPNGSGKTSVTKWETRKSLCKRYSPMGTNPTS